MSSFFLNIVVVLAWVSYTFISDQESKLAAYYTAMGCINMVIMSIEVNIFHTISFGLRCWSFIQIFGFFAAWLVSIFPCPLPPIMHNDKTSQRKVRLVLTYFILSLLAIALVLAMQIILLVSHYVFKVCNSDMSCYDCCLTLTQNDIINLCVDASEGDVVFFVCVFPPLSYSQSLMIFF